MDNNETQMAELFEEGGIADDGMNVDPVSGNEIPPGSMASEVRDDVPAQLSEGEYVVPADVLRFYGVKFFEDLRLEAKQGLGQMEAEGRIGGEPVPAEGQQEMSDLTPEEMAVLQEMGMAVGGMVPQPTQSTDPYMQQQQMYQQPAPVAMGNAGYDDGGVVRGYNQAGVVATPPEFEPTYTKPDLLSQFPMGFSFNQNSTPQGQTTVTLYSPDGLTSESFSLPAQITQHDARIAQGWSSTQVAVTTETSVGSDNNEDYGGPLGKSDKGEGGKKYSEMSAAEITKAYNDNLKARTVMEGMLVINPMLGAFGLATTNYAKKKILERMGTLQVKVPEDKGFLSNLSNTVKGLFDSGDDYDTSADLGTFKKEGKGNTFAEKAAIQKSIDDYQAEAAQNEVQVTTSSGDDDGDPFFEDTFTTTTDVGGHSVTERTYGDKTVGADDDFGT